MNDPLSHMRDIARAHRAHERHHSLLKLEAAAALRRDSNALKVLADHWLGVTDAVPATADGPDAADAPATADGPVSCPDLTDPSAVSTTGVLYMEGESVPGELRAMRRRFATDAADYRDLSHWLAAKMDEAWERMGPLLTSRHADAATPRFRALVHTTAAGDAYGVVARLLDAAATTLNAQDLTPAGVRADIPGAARVIRMVSQLLDLAAARLARAAADLGESDTAWTDFLERTAPR